MPQMGPRSPGLGKGCVVVSGLLLESPPPQSPPTPSAVKPSTPACPASRPTWPAAARSVPRPSPQPCARCSQLLPRAPYILCVPLALWGSGPAQPRTLSPQPQPSRKSVVVGPVYELFICADTGRSLTQGWGWHPPQWAVTLPWSTCLLPPSLCSPAARAPWWSRHSSLVGL